MLEAGGMGCDDRHRYMDYVDEERSI